MAVKRSWWPRYAAVVFGLTVVVPTGFARAEKCAPERFAAVVDQMRGALEEMNNERKIAFRERLAELARQRGWKEEEVVERSVDLLGNDEVKVLDVRAGELLVLIDQLGEAGAQSGSCSDLNAMQQAAQELVSVTRAKVDRLSARLDEQLRSSDKRVAARTAPAPQNLQPAPATPAATARPTSAPPPAPARQPTVPPPSGRPASTSSWATSIETVPEMRAALNQLPPIAAPVDATYSAEDVQAAGHGLFGTLSAELASVIQFAFKSYGRPNGYILGQEGGAAFFAGLRYGNGTLITKTMGTQRIYWQGPSVGFDFGVTGSRTLILVYNIESPADLERRFAGIDGGAYLVGGVGLTFLKRGSVVLAPIRTGLGVRVGASVGYMSFSHKPTLNPL